MHIETTTKPAARRSHKAADVERTANKTPDLAALLLRIDAKLDAQGKRLDALEGRADEPEEHAAATPYFADVDPASHFVVLQLVGETFAGLNSPVGDITIVGKEPVFGLGTPERPIDAATADYLARVAHDGELLEPGQANLKPRFATMTKSNWDDHGRHFSPDEIAAELAAAAKVRASAAAADETRRQNAEASLRRRRRGELGLGGREKGGV